MILHTRSWTFIWGLAFITVLSLAFTIWAATSAKSAVSHVVVPIRPGSRVTHARYRLLDLGTFGGPASFTNEPFNSVPAINNFGMTVGGSTISVPLTSESNPLVCGGISGTIPFVNHAFRWNGNRVTELGALGSANSNCSDASAVNDLGQIAGQSEINEIDPVLGVKEVRAAFFFGNRILNLGTLGGAESTAYGINNRGQVVGFALNAIPDPLSIVDSFIFQLSGGTQTRAVLWQDGIIRDLGTLGGPDAFASFVNERGQIAGFSYLNSTPNPSTGLPTVHPFLWEHGRMRDLGSLGGTLAGLGSINVGGLNDRGEVIGLSTLQGDPGCDTPTGCVADVFLWSRGKMIDLSTSSRGGSPIGAFAINNAGEIVGGGAFPNAPFDAYVWRNGVASDLGHLGDCGSLGFAINSSGQVVGGTFSCADNTHSTAFLWENGAIVDLNQQIPAHSSLHLVVAIAINDRGEIAGIGVPPGVPPANYDSLGHAFLLIPAGDGPGAPIAEHRLTLREAVAMRMRLAGLHRDLRRWPWLQKGI